ncbi:hypothetical protein [Ilumatobacter fluminis]|uniref:hypothetical protein n=1 Tax=Ilumatobacter fluminis TaxID=467091 RepID=UPI00105CC4F5
MNGGAVGGLAPTPQERLGVVVERLGEIAEQLVLVDDLTVVVDLDLPLVRQDDAGGGQRVVRPILIDDQVHDGVGETSSIGGGVGGDEHREQCVEGSL